MNILSLIEFQTLQLINERAKQNLLRYSEGAVLQNIGARSNTFMLEMEKAKATITLELTKFYDSLFCYLKLTSIDFISFINSGKTKL